MYERERERLVFPCPNKKMKKILNVFDPDKTNGK